MKDCHFLLSKGHRPNLNLLKGRVKTYINDHALMRAEERHLPYFPQHLREKYKNIDYNPSKCSFAKAVFYKKFKPVALRAAQKRNDLLKSFKKENSGELGIVNTDTGEKTLGLPLPNGERVNVTVSVSIPSFKYLYQWALEESENIWARDCLFDLWNFENMAIEKYTTCESEIDENGVLKPLLDENNRPIPSYNSNDMVHKVTFLNYYVDRSEAVAKKIWYTMSVDVIPVPSGLDVISKKPKARNGNEKFFTAQDHKEYLSDEEILKGPNSLYEMEVGGRNVSLHKKFDQSKCAEEAVKRKSWEHGKQFTKAFMDGTRKYGEKIGNQTLMQFVDRPIDIDTMEPVKESIRLEPQYHTMGYRVLTFINESIDEDGNKIDGHTEKVRRILSFSNPQKLVLT